MTKGKTAASYSPEVRERAVRLVLEGGGDHPTQWAAINSVAGKIGCTTETLRKWVRQAGRGGGGGARGPGGGAAAGRGRRARRASGSRRSNARCGSCARPTRSCARLRRILPRRSSTAGPG